MKYLLISIFSLLSVFGFSQSTLPLRADTVVIEKSGGSGELKIKNSTRDSLGILVNIGGGRTRFIRAKALNDSTLVIGLDTIQINGGINLTAYNGVRVSGDSALLGQYIGALGDPARLLYTTELPLQNFAFLLRGTTNNHFTRFDSSAVTLGKLGDADSVRLLTNFSGDFLINNGAKNTHTFLKAGGVQFTGNGLYFNSDGTTNGVNIYNTGVSGSSSTAVFRSTNNFATMVGAGAGGPNLASVISSSGFGYNALSSLAPSGGVTGWNNSAFGTNSLKNATTAYGNVMMGINTGFGITSGSLNVGIGGGSMSSIITDSFNTAVGLYSFSEPASLPTLKGLKGRMNTVMGYRAGLGSITAGTWVGTSTNVSSSLFLGAMSGVVAEGDDILNTTILGTGITTNLDSVAVLGRADQVAMIGYTTATSKRAEKLQVNGSGWYKDSLKVGEMPAGTASDDVVVRDAVTKTLKLVTQASISGASPALTTNYIGVGAAGVLSGSSAYTYDGTTVKQNNATAATSITSSTALGSGSGGDIRLFAAATPTAADQRLGAVGFGTLDGGSTENTTAEIAAYSTAAHTPSSTEQTHLRFYTTAVATKTEVMRITANLRVGIGTTTIPATLTLGSGNASVNPFAFTNGTRMTTPTNGSWAWDGGVLLFTPSANTYKRLALVNDAAPSNGQIPIGNGTDFTSATITGSPSVTVTNGSGSIGLAVPTSYLTAADYVPTLTGIANVDAVTLVDAHYMRINDQVSVDLVITIDPTAATTTTNVDIDLPIASTMTNFTNLTGIITSGDGAGGNVVSVSNKARVGFTSAGTSSTLYNIHFAYRIQ